jgi:ABC-type polysaccharide/polyol phosphate export permease
VLELLRTINGNRRLLKELVLRDLKARYVGSSMGFFWSVVYPILNLIVYTFVFRVILNARFDDSAGVRDVAIWMLAGIVVWTAFAETLSRSTNVLVENANLIQKVVFPAGVLPVYLTVSSLVNMAIGLPVVLVGVLFFGYVTPTEHTLEVTEVQELIEEREARGEPLPIPPEALVLAEDGLPVGTRTAACNYCGYEEHLVCPNDGTAMRILALPQGTAVEEQELRALRLGPALLALPLLMLLQGLFMTGLGFFFSAFNLILRDTMHLIGVFTMVWMFCTPIFYPPEMVTAKDDGRYAFILDYNPMYWLIECYRDVMLYDQLPDPRLALSFAGAAALTFFLGATFFQRQRDRFPDLL